MKSEYVVMFVLFLLSFLKKKKNLLRQINVKNLIKFKNIYAFTGLRRLKNKKKVFYKIKKIND